MYLTKINIKNFRLILDASIDFDKELTLIVGKNNSGKTSCMHFIKKIFNEENFAMMIIRSQKERDCLIW